MVSKRPEAAPKLGTIPTSGLPFSIELAQIRLQGTLARPEQITTRTPGHPANRGTAMTRPTDDLLDWDAIFVNPTNYRQLLTIAAAM